jgi:Mg-chelatase subunit ChlD
VAEVASQSEGCGEALARESGGTLIPFEQLAADVVVQAVEEAA